MKEENTYDLIDQYLSGALPEGHEFIIELGKNPELAAEVELQRIVTRAVIDKRLLEVSKEIHAYRSSKNLGGERISKLYLLTLLLVFSTVGVLFLLSKTRTIKVLDHKNIKKNSAISNDSFINRSAETIPSKSKVILPETGNIKPLPMKPAKSITIPGEQLTAIKDSSAMLSMDKVAILKPDKEVDKKSIEMVSVDKTFTRPCDTTLIHVEVTNILPCEKNSNGSIHFENVRGGIGPYTYSLDGAKHFQSDKIFLNLPSSQYDLFVKDRNNCMSLIQKGFELKSKICFETASFVFDPTRETWDIPTDDEKSGKIMIYNKYGQVVFNKNFGIMEHLVWNGTSENGEVLKPGLYIYTIEHLNGLLKQGSVTLSY